MRFEIKDGRRGKRERERITRKLVIEVTAEDSHLCCKKESDMVPYTYT